MAVTDAASAPCLDGGPLLAPSELEALKQELPAWEVIDGHHLHKRLAFPDFASALAWLNRAAAICEEQGHHADFAVGWGYVDIKIHTHKADGLTRADAVLAARFDSRLPPGSLPLP